MTYIQTLRSLVKMLSEVKLSKNKKFLIVETNDKKTKDHFDKDSRNYKMIRISEIKSVSLGDRFSKREFDEEDIEGVRESIVEYLNAPEDSERCNIAEGTIRFISNDNGAMMAILGAMRDCKNKSKKINTVFLKYLMKKYKRINIIIDNINQKIEQPEKITTEDVRNIINKQFPLLWINLSKNSGFRIFCDTFEESEELYNRVKSIIGD